MAAPGARSHDGDTARIDAEFGGVRDHPFERGVIVLERPGKARFGREPIVDADDDAFVIARDPLRHRQLAGDTARHIAAAMKVEERGPRRAGRAGVDDRDRDVGRPLWPGNRGADDGRTGEPGRDMRRHAFAHLRQG